MTALRRGWKRGLAPAVMGSVALALAACGAADTIAPDSAASTPVVSPDACKVLTDADVASALTPAPASGSPAPTGALTISHQYAVINVGSKTAGQCTWSVPDGAQVIGVLIPNTQVAQVADFTSGATQLGSAFVQQGSDRSFISVENGSNALGITLVLAGDANTRLSRLVDLAHAASGAALPTVTAGPSAAASATAAPVASGPGEQVQGQSASATVKETDQLTFNPNSATVGAGQVVEWDNSGSVAHNVTFDDYPSITSGTMSGGDKYQVKFTKAGTYAYHCTFHPGMDGQITVK